MGILGDLVRQATPESSAQQIPGKNKVANIIEFVESEWGLGPPGDPQWLYPVQRIILKAAYGIPLDTRNRSVPVPDSWRCESITMMTEAEYLRYLYDNGRSNIREVKEGEQRREMVLALGRRSGKTEMAACIAAYETYKLLSMGDPQAYYGLPAANRIHIASVATGKEQAGHLYSEVSGYFKKCAFFRPYVANSTQAFTAFQTPGDVKRFGRYADDSSAKATIRVSFHSCISKTLRGAGNIVTILDEMAHFTDSGQSSAESVYTAIRPSKSTFSPKDPDDRRKVIGPVESRIISISSPFGRQGQFYKLFQIGMRGGAVASNMLCINAPTWEVNITIPQSELQEAYLHNPVDFFSEYGAEFSDRSRGWIEDERDIEACIDPDALPKQTGPYKISHFMGVDLALANDNTAIAIGHLETATPGDKPSIVIDLVEQIKAGEGKYVDKDRLDFDEVADWVLDLSKRFYISEGLFDQHCGIPFEQALLKRGLGSMKSIAMTQIINSDVYKNFKDMMWDGRLVLYDHPIPDGKDHCGYIEELLELQEERVSKNVSKVEAPKVEGKHDDRSDALVLMVWAASQKLTHPKYIAKGMPSGKSGRQVPVGERPLTMRQRLSRSGSHESRSIDAQRAKAMGSRRMMNEAMGGRGSRSRQRFQSALTRGMRCRQRLR